MTKLSNGYSLKATNLALKDFNSGSRKVAMYLARFDIMDSDKDIIRPGAFTKSINERGPKSNSNRKIAYLRYHNWEMPIGRFDELGEDSIGLYAVGKISNSTAGNDALADYQDGIIREHSIGFQYIQDKIKYVDLGDNSYFEVTEVKLYEGSAVTFGANEYTYTVDVAKSEGRVEMALKLHEEINMIAKGLHNGQGSDERLYNLEMRLKFLNARFLELAKSEPFVKSEHSQTEEPIQKPIFDWNKVVNNLK